MFAGVSCTSEQHESVRLRVAPAEGPNGGVQREQSEFEALENELAKAKEATQEASAKASELENAANQAKDAEAERTQIQSALDQANKEIERLQSELEQQKMTPPVSVSPSPEEASPPPGQ
jgi:peptidoglycan hydrolase CwlO-like protein